MRLFSTSLILLCAFLMGFAVFKTTAPTHCATILNNDVIFVLTGDPRRIPFARRQMRLHPNATLHIIGAGYNGKKDKHIVVESDSKSTYQNALAIQKIVDANGLNRIVLITTVDHFPRARYLVHGAIPDIEIAACPAPLNGMAVARRLERWLTEYIKYIGTLIGIKEG